MHLFLVTFLLTAGCALMAQSTAVDYFADYNPHITAAEEALLRHNPNTALEHYHAAFALPGDPHNTDLFNAALAAHRTNRFDLLRRYLSELVQQGIPVDYIEQRYHTLQHSAMDWQLLRQELYLAEAQYRTTHDPRPAACFERVDYRHRVIRTANPPGEVRATQDSLNMVGLLDCVAAYGFPTQRQLGQADPTETPYYYQPILRELKRVNATGDDRFGLLPLLDSVARLGRLETETYMDLMSTQHSRIGRAGGYGTTAVIALQDGSNRLYRIVYPPAAVERFNTNRRLLGVRSFDEHADLLVRYFTEGLGDNFPYGIPRQQTVIAYPPEEAAGLELKLVGEVRIAR